MGNAKVVIKQQDRSAIVPSLDGIEVGTVINSDWGDINPVLVTNPSQLVERYSTPNNKKGSSWNGAELLLASSNKVWITRAIHPDAKYSASLVRFKIEDVDFNNYPAPGAVPDLIVKPLVDGITLTGLEAYEFPEYSTDRVYEETGITVSFSVNSSLEVEFTSLTTVSDHVITAGDKISFGNTVNNNSAFYTVETAVDEEIVEHVLGLGGNLSGAAGVEIKKWTGVAAVSYAPKVYLSHTAVATNSIVVNSHDAILNGEAVTMDDGVTSQTVSTKTLENRTAKIVTFTTPVTQTEGAKVQWMEVDELEYRDAFLVVAKFPGAYGDRIKVGIRASKNYVNGFFLDVYFDGILEESFEVTRDNFVDGFGNQMQMESKVNGVSKFIKIVDNLADESRAIPLVTNYGVWRRNNWDIFLVTTLTTAEDIVKGDVLVTLVDATSISIGNRIKFSSTGPEYKALGKTGNTVTIDRPILEDSIAIGSFIYKFNSAITGSTCTFEDTGDLVRCVAHDKVNGDKVSFSLITATTGISVDTDYFIVNKTADTFQLALTVDGTPLTLTTNGSGTFTHNINGKYNGSQYYKFTQTSNFTANKIDDQFTISSNTGVVLDAGTNNVDGGSDGSAITLFDVITAFNKMNNKEKYKISLFCDNGFSYPEVATAINNICKQTNVSHGYLSSPYAKELQANYIEAIKGYRTTEANLNSEFVSMHSIWVKVTDIYNQTKVWVAPSVFSVISQSFVTRNYNMFTPAAGWVYGIVDGLDVTIKLTDGERDELVDSQINPIRYRDGFGLAIWGNETMATKPGPLQLRSVAMLLIMLKFGLENYLEYKLFNLNIKPTWNEIENALTIFIRDRMYIPGGVIDFQVAVEKIITDTDIDNRTCPVFVGITPTMDIKNIPVTIGVFNKSIGITVQR